MPVDLMRRLWLVIALGVGSAGLAACDDADTPAEEAGEAAEEAGEAVEDAAEEAN